MTTKCWLSTVEQLEFNPADQPTSSLTSPVPSFLHPPSFPLFLLSLVPPSYSLLECRSWGPQASPNATSGGGEERVGQPPRPKPCSTLEAGATALEGDLGFPRPSPNSEELLGGGWEVRNGEKEASKSKPSRQRPKRMEDEQRPPLWGPPRQRPRSLLQGFGPNCGDGTETPFAPTKPGHPGRTGGKEKRKPITTAVTEECLARIGYGGGKIM